jgi:hypothetical protein
MNALSTSAWGSVLVVAVRKSAMVVPPKKERVVSAMNV